MPKIQVNAWLDADNTRFSNIPTVCKCGSKLHKVDALNLCNILFVWCGNLKCRYAEVYTT